MRTCGGEEIAETVIPFTPLQSSDAKPQIK